MRRLMLVFLSLSVLVFAVFSLQAQENTITINRATDDTVGIFLTNSDGQTLYTTSEDCTGDCLSVWLPLIVNPLDLTVMSEAIAGTFGTVQRADTGETQLVYNRQMLYTLNNEAIGDVTGVSDTWSLVYPQTLALSGTDELGSFLTTPAGETLYLFTVDSDGMSNCTGDCLSAWPAYTIPNAESLVAGFGVIAQDDLSIFERPDTGELQVVYQGQPLYLFSSDTSIGDTTGQGVGDVWFVVNPVAVRVSEDTGILVGRDGTSLYTTTNDGDSISNCVEACTDVWIPLLATSNADLDKLSEDLQANTTLFARPDGTLQIAYNGQPLYYYIDDMILGDTNGDGVDGIDDMWSVVTVNMSMMASDTVCTVSPANNVNLRSGPSTFYSLSGTLLSTDTIPAIGQSLGTDGFVWYQLESMAWVRSDLVTTTGSCDTLPTVTVAPPPPTPVPAAPTTAPSQPEQPAQPVAPPPATTEES